MLKFRLILLQGTVSHRLWEITNLIMSRGRITKAHPSSGHVQRGQIVWKISQWFGQLWKRLQIQNLIANCQTSGFQLLYPSFSRNHNYLLAAIHLCSSRVAGVFSRKVSGSLRVHIGRRWRSQVREMARRLQDAHWLRLNFNAHKCFILLTELCIYGGALGCWQKAHAYILFTLKWSST